MIEIGNVKFDIIKTDGSITFRAISPMFFFDQETGTQKVQDIFLSDLVLWSGSTRLAMEQTLEAWGYAYTEHEGVALLLGQVAEHFESLTKKVAVMNATKVSN